MSWRHRNRISSGSWKHLIGLRCVCFYNNNISNRLRLDKKRFTSFRCIDHFGQRQFDLFIQFGFTDLISCVFFLFSFCLICQTEKTPSNDVEIELNQLTVIFVIHHTKVDHSQREMMRLAQNTFTIDVMIACRVAYIYDRPNQQI